MGDPHLSADWRGLPRCFGAQEVCREAHDMRTEHVFKQTASFSNEIPIGSCCSLLFLFLSASDPQAIAKASLWGVSLG